MAIASHTAQYMYIEWCHWTEATLTAAAELCVTFWTGGETVQGEWASPRAARQCERRSRETKSVMSREGGGPSGWRGWRENINLQRTEPVMEVGSMVSSDILVLVYYY